MHKAAGDFMAEWNRAIAEDDRGVEAPKAASKRANADVDESDLADIPGAWQKGKLDKLTVPNLRQWAGFHGISLEGKSRKADIVEIVQQALEKGKGLKKAKA